VAHALLRAASTLMSMRWPFPALPQSPARIHILNNPPC